MRRIARWDDDADAEYGSYADPRGVAFEGLGGTEEGLEEGSLAKRPSKRRRANGPDGVDENLSTIGGAQTALLASAHRQIERAIERSVEPNASVEGDAALRTQLQTLLPLFAQRAVFYGLISSAGDAALPRLRHLFGAPPYAFLRPGDIGALRAQGISSGRANLSYGGAHVLNYSQFGQPHLADALQRQYRYMQEDAAPTTPTALLALHGDAAAQTITLTVRLPKRTRPERAAMLASNAAALDFPRQGEVVTLVPTAATVAALSLDATARESAPVRLRIVRVRSAAQEAGRSGVVSTALVQAERE